MRAVTYSESTEAALVAEAHEQTRLLAQIRQHTATLYFVAIVVVVLMALGGLVYVASTMSF